MRAVKTALAGLLAVPAFVAASTPAQAQSPEGVQADYNGRTIDLSQGWQGAQACVVIEIGDVHCYDTGEEMHAARALALSAGRIASLAGEATALSDCGGSSHVVALFSGVNYGGSELDFVQTGGWTNLSAYGFDNTMESWVNQKSCDALVADGTGGSGSWLGMAANSKSGSAGSFNNRASSAYVVY